jgi:hypothetical protein
MTVVAGGPAQNNGTALRARALDAVRSSALDVILASDEPLRTVDIAKQVASRLEMRLSEEELGGLASLVRVVMDSDALFSQSNRQWDLALRMGRAEADRRKPVERAIEDFIDLIGHPAEIDPLAVLATAVYKRDHEYHARLIEKLTSTRSQFFRTADHRIGVSRWLLDISSDEQEDVEYDNFPELDGLNALRGLANSIQADSAVTFAQTLIAEAPCPVDNKALQFLAWCRFPEIEPAKLFSAMHARGELRLERGPSWVDQDGHAQLVAEIRSIVREPDMLADVVQAAMPEEDEAIGLITPTTVRVSAEDLNQVHDFLARDARSYRVSELCQQVLEAFPGSRTYSAVHASLLGQMRDDARFVWVGCERMRLAGSIPPEVVTHPDGLAFDDREYLGEDAAEVDKELPPHEWKHTLDEQVLHSLVQDLSDDSSAVHGPPPSRLEASPALHHYVAGTLYLRNQERGFFGVAPDILNVTLLSGDDQRFEVWVNNRLGLVYGLKEWYDANLPWVGGHFGFEITEQPDEFRLKYRAGDIEPMTDISMERLQQLLVLRGEAAAEGLPLTEIVRRILKAHPDGLHFVTLFTQVNVVRRVRRSQLASVLSGQRYFTQTPSLPGIWNYDERRAAKSQRRKGGPRRPSRDLWEDEDDEYEVD